MINLEILIQKVKEEGLTMRMPRLKSVRTLF